MAFELPPTAERDPRVYLDARLGDPGDPDGPVVSLGLERRPDGTAVCTRLVIEVPAFPADEDPGITASILKSVRLGALVKGAGTALAERERITRSTVNEFHRAAGVDQPAWPPQGPELRTNPPARGRPRLENHAGGEVLKKVVEIVRLADRERRPTVLAVESHFQCPKRTAQNRIRRARELGMLDDVPRKSPGRKGERAAPRTTARKVPGGPRSDESGASARSR